MPFSKRHYRSVSPPQDTPEQIRERMAYRMASRQAIADREYEFPEVTPANAVAALRYQEERIAFHLKRLSQKPELVAFTEHSESKRWLDVITHPWGTK